MRAALRSMFSEDVDLNSPSYADQYRSVIKVRMIVGPDDGPGEESFDVTVCTATWLIEEARNRGPIVGRHLLIVEPMDLHAAVRFLREHVEAAAGDTWDDVAEKVARIGAWEFEDYQPYDPTNN